MCEPIQMKYLHVEVSSDTAILCGSEDITRTWVSPSPGSSFFCVAPPLDSLSASPQAQVCLCQLETTPNLVVYVNNSFLFLMILGWLGSAGRFFWSCLGSLMRLRTSGSLPQLAGMRGPHSWVWGLGAACCLGLCPHGGSRVSSVAQASLRDCGRVPRRCRWRSQGLRGPRPWS